MGCAVGDAIGAPVEMLGPGEVAVYIERHVKTGDYSGVIRQERGYRWEGYPFGQYTDDTQMTIELAESLIACGGLDMDDWGRRIGEMFDEDLVVGGGQSTKAAAKKLKKGVPWKEAGSPPPAGGNGAAMRAGPIGLFFANKDGIIVPAADQGYATHQADQCCAGSVAIASSVALALEDYDPVAALKVVAGNTIAVDVGLGGLVHELAEGVEKGMSPNKVLKWVLALQNEKRWPGVSPWVVSSVLWSLYCATHHHDDFMKAITLAIQPGGDVDSTAAMTGAIVGTRVGFNGIPRLIADKVNDRGARSGEWIRHLGERLEAASNGS